MLLFTQKLVLLYKIVDATNGTHEIKALHAKIAPGKEHISLTLPDLISGLTFEGKVRLLKSYLKKKHLRKNHQERPT